MNVTAIARVVNSVCVVVIVLAFATLNYPHGWDRYDVAFFVKWSKAWDQNPREVYRLTDANYPIVGTFLSAGTVSIIRSTFPAHSIDEILWDFKWFIFAVDALNIVLTWRILSGLRIPNAATTALILYVLPFSWAGGAVWGQIDSVTQFFLLSYVFAFVKICEEKRSLISDSAYLALAAVAFGLGVFSKQLFLFSVPGLIVGFALSTRIIVQRHGSRFAWSLPVPLVCTLVFLWIDRWPALPDSHRSHLAFLLSGFADDWTSIAGLNLWALKPGGPSLCHACTQSGLALYIVAMAYIFWVALALLKRQMHDSNLLFAVLVTLLGLSNLAFNVLLTGVHERYLFHTFPFLIIGGLVLTRKGLMRVPHLALTTAIGSVYGIYVWMILNAPLHHWPTRSLRGSLVVSLAALLGYSCVWLRELNGALISSSRVRRSPP